MERAAKSTGVISKLAFMLGAICKSKQPRKKRPEKSSLAEAPGARVALAAMRPGRKTRVTRPRWSAASTSASATHLVCS